MHGRNLGKVIPETPGRDSDQDEENIEKGVEQIHVSKPIEGGSCNNPQRPLGRLCDSDQDGENIKKGVKQVHVSKPIEGNSCNKPQRPLGKLHAKGREQQQSSSTAQLGVANLTLEQRGSNLCASWDAPTGSRGLLYFTMLYCDGQEIAEKPLKTPATSKTFTNILPSKEYFCEVWVKTSDGSESGKRAYSNVVVISQDDGTIAKGVERMNISRTTKADSRTKSRPNHGEIHRHGDKEVDVSGGVEQTNLLKASSRRVANLRDLFEKNKEKDSRAKVGGEKTGQAMSDEERKKKIALLSERISALLETSEHLKASKLLEELTSLQLTKELDTSLQMAECFLHLEKLREARETIGAVRVIVTSHALSANDVFKLGCDLCKKSSYVRAIILLRIASDMYKTNASSPDDVVNRIYRCIIKAHDATKSLIMAGGRSRVIGLDFGVEYLKQMFDCLSDVENAEPGNKTLRQAWCLKYIEFNYELANENKKRLKPLQTGIEILEHQFGSNASKYRLYGHLLNNTGHAYENLGKFSDAEKYFVKSIKAYQKATDYAYESQRQSDIEFTKSNLRNTRA